MTTVTTMHPSLHVHPLFASFISSFSNSLFLPSLVSPSRPLYILFSLSFFLSFLSPCSCYFCLALFLSHSSFPFSFNSSFSDSLTFTSLILPYIHSISSSILTHFISSSLLYSPSLLSPSFPPSLPPSLPPFLHPFSLNHGLSK